MTPNKEDYLKIIFELGGDTQKVSNKQIVTSLNVSAASVTEMVNKLVHDAYLTHTPYQGIQLTAAGAKEAALLVRNHRLWEVFLVDKLAYQSSEVHQVAEMLEHVTSPKLAQHLAAFLQAPTRCPHGGTIPDEIGHFQKQSTTALADVQVGQKVQIDRMLDDSELLQYTLEIGLKLNDEVEIMKIGLYESPLTARNLTTNQEIQVGLKAAQHIFVK